MTHDPDHRPRPPGGLPRRWPLSLPATAALVAGAALLLGGAAFVMRPAEATAPTRGSAISIAHRDQPPPVIVSGDKMDVMSDPADSFDGVPARPEADPIGIGDWLAGAEVEAYEPPPPPKRVEADAPVEPRVRRYRSDGREDCTYARSRAEAMICRDNRLAAMDQEMQRALDRAVDLADQPRRVLRDQRRWERARENAAIDGPEAVEDVYRQRLDELDF